MIWTPRKDYNFHTSHYHIGGNHHPTASDESPRPLWSTIRVMFRATSKYMRNIIQLLGSAGTSQSILEELTYSITVKTKEYTISLGSKQTLNSNH